VFSNSRKFSESQNATFCGQIQTHTYTHTHTHTHFEINRYDDVNDVNDVSDVIM